MNHVKLIFILLFSFSSSELYSQVLNSGILKINLQDASFSQNKPLIRTRISFKKSLQTTDSTIRISPETVLEDWGIAELKYSLGKSFRMKSVLVGRVMGKYVIIIDENRNSKFDDEKIFSFGEEILASSTKSYDSYPRLTIDSGCQIKVSLHFESTGNRYLSFIDLLPISYYTGFTLLGEVFYEIAIIPHPLEFKAVNSTSPFIATPKTRLAIYSKHSDLDSIRYMTYLQFAGNKNEHLLLNNKSFPYIVSDAEVINDTLLLSFSNRPHLNNKETVYRMDTAIVDTEGSRLKLTFPSNKGKLILFTGSWCIPCKKAIEDLKINRHKITSVFDIVIFSAELSLQDAKKYKSLNNLKDPVVFQQYNSLSEDSFIKKFSNTFYPTLIAIDTSGKEIYRQSGSNSFEGLIKILDK